MHYVAVCLRPADTVKCRCEWDRPRGHLKDTYTHTDLPFAQISGLHKQTEGHVAVQSLVWQSNRLRHTHTFTH